jgi:hypothetical protein
MGLCQHINEILTIYDDITGRAQILFPPKAIKVVTTPED